METRDQMVERLMGKLPGEDELLNFIWTDDENEVVKSSDVPSKNITIAERKRAAQIERQQKAKITNGNRSMETFEIPALWDSPPMKIKGPDQGSSDLEDMIPEAGQTSKTIEQIIKKICKTIHLKKGVVKTKEKRVMITTILKKKGYPLPSNATLKKLAYAK